MTTSPAGVWSPSAGQVAGAEMTRLLRDVGVDSYEELWRWSVEDIERFWSTVWERYHVTADGDPGRVLGRREMPGAQWFPDVALSFPEHVFRGKEPDAAAIHYASELRELSAWTWADLREQTARIRSGLVSMGIGQGDRVAAYMPNLPETVAAFLAVTSLGAIWSCCSPDFGAATVIDRFAQISPRVLLAVDGYRYGGKDYDRRQMTETLAKALPTLEHIVVLPYLAAEGNWDSAFPPTTEPLTFARVPFSHPLWIVYSSGTTGGPKAMVHGHGGPLLEHLKTWRLHHDVREGDRILWFTSSGWIMWNYLVSALLSPVSIVLYDGDPGHPDLGVLWELVQEAGVTFFGMGAAYLHACLKSKVDPVRGHDVSRLRAMGSTGSPLAPEAHAWVREHVGADVWLASTSGGTDVASAFVGGTPLSEVRPGEIPARMLGVAAEAWDEQGRPVVDAVGELVVTQPMPSMPVGFWNDPGDQRYRESYFSMFPGVWRQGDWVRFTSGGSAVIYGRSDATINRAGIRIGSAEIYAAVLPLDEIERAIAVDVPSADGTGPGWLGLFVVLAKDAVLSEELCRELRARIRRDCSPRHVPDAVIAVPDVPTTLTGKLLEVPVKKLLMGYDRDSAANRDALANPAAYDWFAEFAAEHGPRVRANPPLAGNLART